MKYIASILLAVLIPQLAFARDPYRLPAGKRSDDPMGVFYTFEEYKVLLKMDLDLEFYEKTQLPKVKQELELLKQAIVARDTIIKSKETQLDLANKDRARLTDKWAQENKARLECQNKPSIGSWIAWGTAGAAGLTAIILGVILAVKK